MSNQPPDKARECWRQVKPILEEALEVPPEERAALVNKRCGPDEELRREVGELLASHDEVEADGEIFCADDSPDTIGPYEILKPIASGGIVSITF